MRYVAVALAILSLPALSFGQDYFCPPGEFGYEIEIEPEGVTVGSPFAPFAYAVPYATYEAPAMPYVPVTSYGQPRTTFSVPAAANDLSHGIGSVDAVGGSTSDGRDASAAEAAELAKRGSADILAAADILTRAGRTSEADELRAIAERARGVATALGDGPAEGGTADVERRLAELSARLERIEGRLDRDRPATRPSEVPGAPEAREFDRYEEPVPAEKPAGETAAQG